jgi:AcrR family transcriptional regulator
MGMSEAKHSHRTASMRKGRDPQQSRADILAAATKEFSSHGFAGARVDAIAARTQSTRAMIYYYFGGKEALYVAVLETAYRGIREAEKTLDLAHLPPAEAIRRLVRFSFDYYQDNPSFVALVIAENQAGGTHIRRAHQMHGLNVSIVDTIRAVLVRGVRNGVFRAGIDPVDLHMVITSLGWFQVANRHTFGYLFKRDLGSRSQIARNRKLITDIILRFVSSREESGRNPGARRLP